MKVCIIYKFFFFLLILEDLKEIRLIFPKLTDKLKKGDCGRIGVIGGSTQYSGAPYFASISTIKTICFFIYFCLK